MQITRALAFAGLIFLTTGGLAGAAPLAPPKAAVSGKFTFTFRATNAKVKPGVLDVSVVAACAAPCTVFATRWKARGQSNLGAPVRWKWNGRQYVHGPTTSRGRSSCGGKTKTIAAGYDVLSKYALVPGSVKGGRITTFRGTGIDDYIVNAKGKAGGCKPGAYDFAITARTP